ncbi:uncharacterized protein L3040_002998 [Drepanopeziza brunnea f. sp. 'multigermtubi']|uniref:uncharacterized protein n=1 Tax=Drepanopeziza brunnea f. sp. 'multigermtubi' TaxID=698441 RepID=UPI00239D6343|nr:hypothetical protein L3040_002998 [Drepanopeziza brunnea f. sp. 'multigermtubi']
MSSSSSAQQLPNLNLHPNPNPNPSKKAPDTYYEMAMRWIEDTYLKYFGENRTSYGIKDSLSRTEVSGNKDVDGIQHAVGEAAGNVFAEGAVGAGVGRVVDKGLLSR